MKTSINLKQITVCVLLFLGWMLTGCSDSEDARPFAEDFFEKVIDKKYSEAAKMIDSRSKLYPKRFEIVRKLKANNQLGLLNATDRPMASSIVTISNFSFTSVEFPVKLNYDSTSTMVSVQVIDRGDGFRINKIER